MSAIGVNYIQYQSCKAIEGICTGGAAAGQWGWLRLCNDCGVGMGNMMVMANGMAEMATCQ